MVLSTPSPEVVRNLIARAVVLCGGSEKKLGIATGYSQNAIWSAKKKGFVSPKMATKIEHATNGKLSRCLFRPDIFAPLDVQSVQTADDTDPHGEGASLGHKSVAEAADKLSATAPEKEGAA